MGSNRKRTMDADASDKPLGKRSKIHQSEALSPPLTVTIHDQTFEPTPVFDTFWRFAAERHAITEKRLKGVPAPYVSIHYFLMLS